MGYYTRYELEYEVPEQVKSTKVKEFEEQCRKAKIPIPTDVKVAFDEQLSLEAALEHVLNDEGFGSGYGPLMNFVNGDGDSCKWYDYKKDMLELSNQFPSVLFTLSGEGEESGDIWKHYFLGGKSQRCNAELVFPDFCPEKLK
jgi:hypothetical protein